MTAKAKAFMAANAKSPVVSAYVHEPDHRKPGKGASYTLKDGSKHKLSLTDCRALPETFSPKWDI